ncbi:MAG: hypothetical protein WC603_02960 [Candidatus Paceibacterota bacterium]|jgi:hypothetical protein
MEIGVIGNCLTVAQATCTGTGVMKELGGAFYGYSGALVTILGAVIGIGVAYLVFRFGWRKVKGSTK